MTETIKSQLPNVYLNGQFLGSQTISSLVRQIDSQAVKQPNGQLLVTGTNAKGKPIFNVLLTNGAELTNISNLYLETNPSNFGTTKQILNLSKGFKKLFNRMVSKLKKP